MRILLFLTIFLVAIKDFFSIIKFLIPSLSFLTLLPAFMTVLVAGRALGGVRGINIKIFDIFFLFFILSDVVVFFLINYLGYGQGYSLYSELVTLFYYSILPLVMYFCAKAYPQEFLDAVRKVLSFLIPVVVFVCFVQLAAMAVNKDAFAAFMVGLSDGGVISYPLQTHSGEFEVRLQGIFYSSLGLAIFVLISIAYVFDSIERRFYKILLMSVFLVLLWFTYNRNGLLAFFIFFLFIFLDKFRWNEMKFGDKFFPWLSLILLVGAFFIPFFLASIQIKDVDDSAIGKLSTLASRAGTWNELIYNRSDDLTYGAGYVQGLESEGGDDLMIDNLFFSKLLQVGIFPTLLLFLFFLLLVFSRRPRSSSTSALFLATIAMFSLNNIFVEPLYVVFVLSFYLAGLEVERRRIFV